MSYHRATESLREKLLAVLGKNARVARKWLGLTQEQVAERIGISREFYARIERCEVLPGLATLCRMADVLGVSVDHLMGRDVGDLASAREPEVPPKISAIVDRVRDKPAYIRLVRALLKALEED